MKKILVSAILGVAALAACAQEYTTVTLETSGTLATVLQANNATNAEYLKVICTEGVQMVDADFAAIRSNLRNTLKGLDLSETSIYAYGSSTPTNALIYMYNLETVILPEGLTAVGQYTFFICYNLRTIKLPSTLLYIRLSAFQGCESLQLDKLPEGLLEINDNAFFSQAGTTISNSGFSYTPKSSMTGLTASELPAGITVIGENAFNGTGVTFSEFPEGLKTLGNTAFRNTNVTFSSFPASLFAEGGSLGNSVFVNCLGITEFTIPDEMTTIPSRTFYWDKSVTKPRTFYCTQTKVPSATYDPSGTNGTFGNSDDFSNVTMYVPLEAVSAYESQSPVTPYSTMNITGMLYLVGNMTENDATPSGYGNPSYMFTKSMEEVDDTETAVYTLNVASVSDEDKFYLQSVSQIYSMNMNTDQNGLVMGNKNYTLTAGNTDQMSLDGSYLNVTFTFIPASGLFYYTGTQVKNDFVITPGNDQTNQSGELNSEDYDIVMTTPYDGVIVFIYVPSDYTQDVAYYEVSSNGIAPAAIQTAKVTDGYFTVPLSVGTSGDINIYESDNSTEPAATFTYKVVSGIPTGVETIDEFGTAAEYFTLQGTKVANPAPGNIYIKIANGKVSKILM